MATILTLSAALVMSAAITIRTAGRIGCAAQLPGNAAESIRDVQDQR